MKKLSKFIPILFFTAIVPMPAFAACTATGGLGLMICNTKDLLGSMVPLLVALGVVYFIWGVVQYFIGDSEEAKKTGKDRIIYGIIGLAVIVGMWGLVNVVITTFSLNSVTPSLTPVTGLSPGLTCTTPVSGSKFPDYLDYIRCIINNSIIPLIFAVAVVMFVWGVIKFFIIDADEEAKRAQGKQFMIWGIIALAVMLSVWGLVAIFGDTFNVGSKVLPHVTPPTQ